MKCFCPPRFKIFRQASLPMSDLSRRIPSSNRSSGEFPNNLPEIEIIWWTKKIILHSVGTLHIAHQIQQLILKLWIRIFTKFLNNSNNHCMYIVYSLFSSKSLRLVEKFVRILSFGHPHCLSVLKIFEGNFQTSTYNRKSGIIVKKTVRWIFIEIVQFL